MQKNNSQIDWQSFEEKRKFESILKQYQKELESLGIELQKKRQAFWQSPIGEIYRLQIDVLSHHHYMQHHFRYKEFEMKYWHIVSEGERLKIIRQLLKEAKTYYLIEE
jgi:hypothetical protein